MKLRTGQRGVCKTCGGDIYFSEARDPGDPWVHSDWTKHRLPSDHPHDPRHASKLPAYDHRAEPIMHEFILEVRVSTPVTQYPVVRHDVAQVLWDSERFTNVEVAKP